VAANTQSIAHAKELEDDADLNSLKMMRVASAEQTKDMNAGQKMDFLYNMYNEAHQGKTGGISEEEKVKLRGEIYQLKQSTHLNAQDKVRLHELQEKLKAAK
jgi:hypothetical protein